MCLMLWVIPDGTDSEAGGLILGDGVGVCVKGVATVMRQCRRKVTGVKRKRYGTGIIKR